MTEDTRKALEIIKPIADEMNIRVSADDHILYVDDMGIGINWNSTFATVWEFIGYLIVIYDHTRRDIDLTEKQFKTISKYWIAPEKIKEIRGIKDNA